MVWFPRERRIVSGEFRRMVPGYEWALRFDFPEGTLYADWYKDAPGLTHAEQDAALFKDEHSARLMLGLYGEKVREFGVVYRVRGAD